MLIVAGCSEPGPKDIRVPVGGMTGHLYYWHKHENQIEILD